MKDADGEVEELLLTSKQVKSSMKKYDRKHSKRLSLSKPVEVVNGKWACTVCTFVNPKSKRKCETCMTPKPKQAGDTQSVSSGAKASGAGGSKLKKKKRGGKENGLSQMN